MGHFSLLDDYEQVEGIEAHTESIDYSEPHCERFSEMNPPITHGC